MTILKYKVVSDSMTPLIPIGAELHLKKYHPGMNLKKFDILVFKENDVLMCHYFWHQNVFLDKDLITTRALKDGKLDVPFSTKQILGVVINYKINWWMKLRILFTRKK
jgi:hypothetical protein